ncbi:Cadherin domain-containing protein [Pseudomonas sp. IT-347P]|uniref:hypothetical protein n=1 Tax=Pseudomonas sp. IT-347P TaxID=3026458 RepID=UPI0039DFE65B
MSTNKKENSAFTANLYVDGLPVVLNHQRLRQRLRDPRLTRREQMEVEVALADKRETRFLTLADHEDDKPLLLTFTPHGDSFAITVALRGVHDGARLFIESRTHNVLVSQKESGELFSIRTVGLSRAVFRDLQPGPLYIEIESESNNKPLYRNTADRMNVFNNVDPNVTGHNAFNNKPVIFVLKIIDQLPLAA